MHLVDNADFVHTFADIVQTLNRHYADYHTRVHLVHFSVVISGKFPYCALSFAGPTWRQRDGSVLVASRRFDRSRSRKTKGSLGIKMDIDTAMIECLYDFAPGRCACARCAVGMPNKVCSLHFVCIVCA